MRLSSLIAGVVLVVSLCGAAPAMAWEISKSTNGVIINRQSEDSTAAWATGFIYYGYKGGEESWSATYTPTLNTSYNYSQSLGTVFQAGSSSDAVEIPLVDGYRLQAVMLSQSGVGQRYFALIHEPLKVTVENTRVPVSTVGTVGVSSLPSVSIGSSLSVDGTLPVSVDSIAGVDRSGLLAGAVLGALASGALTYRAVHGA